MYSIEKAYGASSYDGHYIGIYDTQKEARRESPIKKSISGYTIVCSKNEEIKRMLDETQDFYYNKEEAEKDLAKLIL